MNLMHNVQNLYNVWEKQGKGNPDSKNYEEKTRKT